jgi:putative flippase GtrA
MRSPFDRSLPVEFLIYLVIGGSCAAANMVVFLLLLHWGVPVVTSTGLAFLLAAVLNYFLCVLILFRNRQRWSSTVEIFMYVSLVAAVGLEDVGCTKALIALGASAWFAKALSSAFGLVLNFAGRRFLIFSKPAKSALP